MLINGSIRLQVKVYYLNRVSEFKSHPIDHTHASTKQYQIDNTVATTVPGGLIIRAMYMGSNYAHDDFLGSLLMYHEHSGGSRKMTC